MILLLALGCRDPEAARYREALAAYDQGREALAAGQPEAAARHFAEAARIDPDSPALPAWRATALDRAGDLSGAQEALEEALARFPGDVTLRYNRAALLARQGVLEEAALELRALYAAGAVDPAEVGEDPDFALLAEDPRYQALAPPPSVVVTARGEEGPVLLGEPATLDLEIASRAGALVSITDMGDASGLLRHARTVEDDHGVEGRVAKRTLTVTWRAVAPGEAALGPWLVAAGGVSAVTERVPLEVLALPGRAPSGEPDEAGSVQSVEAMFAGKSAPWAGRERGRVLVVHSPGARAEVRGAEGEVDPAPVQLELRRAGQTEAQGELHRVSGAATVRVTRGGHTLLEAEVPPDELTPP